MFELEGGLTLALYPRSELAKDAAVPLAAPKTGEFSIGQIVASREEVDAVMAQARAAGALVTDEPHERAWASTPDTSAISTGICGRSSGARGVSARLLMSAAAAAPGG